MGVSVAGIAFKNDRYFIARRKPEGQQGGKWEFPGGKLEPGESATEALIREYREEFSIDIEVLQPVCQTAFLHKDSEFVLHAFLVRLESDPVELLEHTEFRWATLEEIASLPFVDSDRKILPYLW
jgi:8-oxo-dGTP diphosphatase